jgi:hypothetical protein
VALLVFASVDPEGLLISYASYSRNISSFFQILRTMAFVRTAPNMSGTPTSKTTNQESSPCEAGVLPFAVVDMGPRTPRSRTYFSFPFRALVFLYGIHNATPTHGR